MHATAINIARSGYLTRWVSVKRLALGEENLCASLTFDRMSVEGDCIAWTFL